MSDPNGYIALTVIGPDTAEALTWLRRRRGWEDRLEDLHRVPERTEDEEGRPTSAA